MRKIDRLVKYMEAKGLNDNRVTLECDLSQGLLGQARRGKSDIGAKALEKILNKYQDLNRVWLLTGEGQMLNSQKQEAFNSSPKGLALPLIQYPAMAGYNEDNWSVMVSDCPLYSVPGVSHNADFLIKVAGESMQPKFFEGDLLACKFIKDILFFQWGKTYVLDTSQGVMVKNIYEDKSNPDNILLVSENSEKYPPFAIPRSDVRKLALVVGMLRIRME